ncbi:anaerobic ribonucleoside-triphosphate reductase activating protein [Chitinibacteraceae bacterium HSL-7]
MARNEPALAGLVPFSSVDWPGHLVATLFVAGCPWRCAYCHNPHLQERHHPAGAPAWDDVLAWLPTRAGLLDGVVFSGGEPLAEPRLPEMIESVRALGFRTALHTAGAYPKRLAACLPYLDWVGLDIKTLRRSYAALTGKRGSGAAADQALDLLLAGGVPFECRTTVHPALHDDTLLAELADDLLARGVHCYALQRFQPRGCTDSTLICGDDWTVPGTELLQRLEQRFPSFSWRAS